MPRVTCARPGHMGQDQVSCSTHLLVYVHIRDRESNRNQHQEHDIETDSLSWMQEQLRTPRASCARLGRMGQDQVAPLLDPQPTPLQLSCCSDAAERRQQSV